MTNTSPRRCPAEVSDSASRVRPELPCQVSVPGRNAVNQSPSPTTPKFSFSPARMGLEEWS
jgi:hypothetical protein